VFSLHTLSWAETSTPSESKPLESIPLEFMMDRPPVSLNPRSTVDANGQRLNALMFRALTRINADLNPQPDLAQSWKFGDGGKSLQFLIPPNSDITAQKMAQCLETYRAGKPISPYMGSFPNWLSTEAKGNAVTLHFSKPDPYVVRNLSLLRYFGVKGQEAPCVEPGNAPLITSGPYTQSPWQSAPDSEMFLKPVKPGLHPIHITFIEDDNTRVLKLLRGDVDATLNTLSVGKTDWLNRTHSDQFNYIQRDSVRAGYVLFNFRDPILKIQKVRQAIAHAIDRELIAHTKLHDYVVVAGSLLYPSLPESLSTPFAYDPELSARLLDEAGFPLKDGKRFTIVYKTTPVREGFEQALIFKDMLTKIGVELTLEMVEPAVYLASVRKGNFQMIASVWLGVADGSILYRTLYSKNADNRGAYSNPAVDAILEKAVGEMDDKKRIAEMQEVQRITADELPYFPLFFWGNGLIVRKGAPFFSDLKPGDLSLSGALEPTLIKRSGPPFGSEMRHK
jgi:peptide/nickel transport system substrate-binding protein